MKLPNVVLKKHLLIGSCLLLMACNGLKQQSPDEKFLGQWVYVQNIPDLNKPDHTMDGAITSITKLDGTTESYKVKFWTGDLGGVFTLENDSTLKAIDANLRLKYSAANQHLFLELKPGEGIDWAKLK